MQLHRTTSNAPDAGGSPPLLLQTDAVAACAWLAQQQLRPDLIYIDPPFATGRNFALAHRDHEASAHLEGGTLAYRDAWAGGLQGYLDEMERWLIAIHAALADEGSLILHCDHHAAPYLALCCDRIFGFGDRAGGGAGFRNELIWSYGLGGSSPRCHAKKHDTLLWYSKGSRWFFAPHMVPATSQRLAGKLKKGTSIWDIPSINNMAKERTGYPTQKPLALLARIVACHAPPGGLVADLCCGSGTTLVAAASAGRRAIGADLGALAQEVAGGRLLAAGLGLERWTPATD